MVEPQRINPAWAGRRVVVAASGPSLTAQAARDVRMARWFDGWRVIAVNDAYRLMPRVDILYAADFGWWRAHEGAKNFYGERWTCHSHSTAFVDDKSQVFQQYGLRLVAAADGKGFSFDPARIHYGDQPHSGFQAVNLALLLGAAQVVLIGFDMRRVEGRAHFFGDHPEGLRRQNENYADFIKAYPPDPRIVNATPDSALKVYRFVRLDEALRRDDCLHRDGAVAHA